MPVKAFALATVGGVAPSNFSRANPRMPLMAAAAIAVTLDGTVALIAFTLEGETYLIDGVPQTEYFDNLGW